MNRTHFTFASASCGAFTLLGLMTVSPAHAQFINGNFGTGTLFGWTSDGNNPIQTALIGSGPTGGDTHQVLIQNSDTTAYPGSFAPPGVTNSVPAGTADDSYSHFESFAGVSDSAFTSLIPKPKSGDLQYLDSGSAIQQIISLKKGDTITFDYDFLADGDSSDFNAPPYVPYPHTTDGSFVDITDGMANTLSLLGNTTTSTFAGSQTPINDPYYYQTATNNGQTYVTYSFVAPETGSYTVTVGAFTANNSSTNRTPFGPDALLVDNFTYTPAPQGGGGGGSTPEPGTFATLSGLLTAGGLVFRRRRQA